MARMRTSNLADLPDDAIIVDEPTYPFGMKAVRLLNKAKTMLLYTEDEMLERIENGTGSMSFEDQWRDEPTTHQEAIDVYWLTRALPTRRSLEYEFFSAGAEGPDYYLYERLESFFDFDAIRASEGRTIYHKAQRYLRENFSQYEHLRKMYRNTKTGEEYRHKHWFATDEDYAHNWSMENNDKYYHKWMMENDEDYKTAYEAEQAAKEEA